MEGGGRGAARGKAVRTREDDETIFGHAERKGPMGIQGRPLGAAGLWAWSQE